VQHEILLRMREPLVSADHPTELITVTARMRLSSQTFELRNMHVSVQCEYCN